MEIVLASKNPGKLKELAELALDAPWLHLSLAPESFNPEETGTTFAENAMIKARLAALISGQWALADDSGLAVDALEGRPGVYSARFCEGTDADRRRKLLSEMTDIPEEKRHAAFVCNMALARPNGDIECLVEAKWKGIIGFTERGTNGFGYDPIFFLPHLNLSAAELPSREKNKLSHRGQAFRKMLALLQENFLPKDHQGEAL